MTRDQVLDLDTAYYDGRVAGAGGVGGLAGGVGAGLEQVEAVAGRKRREAGGGVEEVGRAEGTEEYAALGSWAGGDAVRVADAEGGLGQAVVAADVEGEARRPVPGAVGARDDGGGEHAGAGGHVAAGL